MPIFRKKVSESSSAIFAIRADCRTEAEKAFSEFFNGDTYNDIYEDYRQHMDCNGTDAIIDLATFENEDEYNRSHVEMHDFYLDADKLPKRIEPKYNLYLIHGNNHSYALNIKKVFYGITMDKMLEVVSDYNKDYILKPDPSCIPAKCFIDAHKEGTTVVAYRLERRAD